MTTLPIDRPLREREILRSILVAWRAAPLVFLGLSSVIVAAMYGGLALAVGFSPVSSRFVSLRLGLDVLAVALVSGIHAKGVELLGRGHRPTVVAVLRSLRRAPQLVAVVLASSGPGISISIVALNAPGWAQILAFPLGIAASWIAIRLSVAPTAIMCEDRSARAALEGAWHVTRGNGWRIFGLQLVTVIPFAVLNAVVLTHAGWPSGLRIGIWLLALTFSVSASAVVATMFYFDLTARASLKAAEASDSNEATRG